MRRTWLSRRMWLAWLAAILAGVLATIAPWLERLRPLPLGHQAAYELHVTSGADEGTGTLREAIFTADTRDRRVRIFIDVPLITLSTPLPPIINPAGVVFEARSQTSRIDASGVSAGPVLDISAADTVISGVEIVGAAREAILLRASGAKLTGVRVRDAETGIYLVEGADDLTVTDSNFDRNVIGIQLPPGARGVRISNSRFQRHMKAGIWSVAPEAGAAESGAGIQIMGNRFEADDASVVLINTAARLERNTFLRARTAAMFISGAAMRVQGNRVRSGHGFGITSDALDRAVISGNEIDHNCAGGILMRNAQNTQVLSNRLYSNGYGIVVVLGPSQSPNTVADNLVFRHFEDGLYLIGASPLIRRNRLMENRGAGLHLSSLRRDENQIAVPQPLFEANVLAGNGNDAPAFDEYRASAADVAPETLSDCAWRVDPDEAGTPQ